MKTEMQTTSLFAYHSEILPKLGERQKAVYETLRDKDMTDIEIAHELGWQINCVTGRRGEIVKLGLAKKVGIRIQNGRPAIVWGIIHL